MKEVLQLENRVNALVADSTSPYINQNAVCAVIRDIVIPMVNAEITGTKWWHFLARTALGKVRDILEGYLARNCPA